MNINDGGPAFPHPEVARLQDGRCVVADADPGMTIRDWFAGQAISGMITPGCVQMTEATRKARASEAYAIADAMLKAREAKP